MKSQVSHTGRQAKPGSRRVLVVANEIIEGQTPREEIGLQVGEQRAEVRVIGLNSRLRHWLADEDESGLHPTLARVELTRGRSGNHVSGGPGLSEHALAA